MLRSSSANPRQVLLEAVLSFVHEASAVQGVRRIALLGSLATNKPVPKDADVLVTIEASMDLQPLATAGRRLKGRCQAINHGADIFLSDATPRYLGRVCRHRVCHLRASCEALSCGVRQHLRDDLYVLTLRGDDLERPAFGLWPAVTRSRAAPSDVEQLLLKPLEASSPAP